MVSFVDPGYRRGASAALGNLAEPKCSTLGRALQWTAPSPSFAGVRRCERHNGPMGAPINIFRLFSYQPCGHELLVRAVRPAASNADQRALNAADDIADSATKHLCTWWEQRCLQPECPHQHTSSLVGEMQEGPVGEDLFSSGRRRLGVWAARTKYGAPWMVLGTASTEAEFWQQVQEDSDLLDLGPLAPAELRHVYFLTDEDHLSSQP